MLNLLTGLSLAALPTILLWVLIIALFLLLLFMILSKVPEPIGSLAKWIVLVVGGIILLWILIAFARGGEFAIH